MVNDLSEWPARSSGRVLKASSVQLRRTDPHSVPVAQRVADAERAGYQRGFAEGHAAGAQQAGAELAAAAAQLRTSVLAALDQHAGQIRANRADDAERLAELALAVAEWAVRRELSSVPASFFGRLQELLTERHRHQLVEITTSPDLVEATRHWIDDPAVRVLGDEDLDVGEARVQLDDSTVFATFADAFEQARELLDQVGHDEAGPRRPAGTNGSGQAIGATGQDGTAGAPDLDDIDDIDEMVEVLFDVTEQGSW